MRVDLSRYIHDISPKLNIHDFRMVKGDTHTNLIFDINVPLDFPKTNREIKEALDLIIAQEKEAEDGQILMPLQKHIILMPCLTVDGRHRIA